MKLDFYYWASMCPINQEMLDLLIKYKNNFDLSLHDITDNQKLAKKMRMYYPTLTVVEKSFRYYSPINSKLLDMLCKGLLPQEKPYTPHHGTDEFEGSIVPITENNYFLAARCTGRKHPCGCKDKIQFLKANGLSIFGFMNLNKGKLLGGAEYMPSMLVPYDIPKDERTVFITCVYLSDTDYDYKSSPLRALEQYLSNNYNKIIVISDEHGVFPNGNMEFFLRNGYIDMGIVAFEKDYCTLHMMYKTLS